MSWIVIIAGRAKKEIKKLPQKDSERVEVILKEIESNPYSRDIEKIQGEKYTWRKRVGNYRIIYDIYKDRHLVVVHRIERRTSTTY